MIIVTNKPCSFLKGAFFHFFNVSKVIEIKYFTESTKLDGSAESGPTSEGKQSGLWAFLSRVYLRCCSLQEITPLLLQVTARNRSPPRGTSYSPEV